MWFIKEINWIQTARVNRIERIKAKETKKNQIINYVLQNPRLISPKDVEKVFKVDLRTYFGSNSKEIIKKIRKNTNTYTGPIYKGHSLVR